MRHIIILRNFSNQLGFKETNLPLSHTPSSLSSPSLTHTCTLLNLSPPYLSLLPLSLTHSSLSIHYSLSLPMSIYLCLLTYVYLTCIYLPTSTYLRIYINTSTYLYQHTIYIYLPLYVNLPSSTYLHQHMKLNYFLYNKFRWNLCIFVINHNIEEILYFVYHFILFS